MALFFFFTLSTLSNFSWVQLRVCRIFWSPTFFFFLSSTQESISWFENKIWMDFLTTMGILESKEPFEHCGMTKKLIF